MRKSKNLNAKHFRITFLSAKYINYSICLFHISCLFYSRHIFKYITVDFNSWRFSIFSSYQKFAREKKKCGVIFEFVNKILYFCQYSYSIVNLQNRHCESTVNWSVHRHSTWNPNSNEETPNRSRSNFIRHHYITLCVNLPTNSRCELKKKPNRRAAVIHFETFLQILYTQKQSQWQMTKRYVAYSNLLLFPVKIGVHRFGVRKQVTLEDMGIVWSQRGIWRGSRLAFEQCWICFQ